MIAADGSNFDDDLAIGMPAQDVLLALQLVTLAGLGTVVGQQVKHEHAKAGWGARKSKGRAVATNRPAKQTYRGCPPIVGSPAADRQRRVVQAAFLGVRERQFSGPRVIRQQRARRRHRHRPFVRATSVSSPLHPIRLRLLRGSGRPRFSVGTDLAAHRVRPGLTVSVRASGLHLRSMSSPSAEQSTTPAHRAAARRDDPARCGRCQLGCRFRRCSRTLEPLPAQAPVALDSAELVTLENQLVQVRLGMASSLFAALRAKHAPTAAPQRCASL